MNAIIKLYSTKDGEILTFLTHFYGKEVNFPTSEEYVWQKEYENPIEMVDMIGAFIENKEDYQINMWISLDKDLYINITKNNADEIIRYLYERYPY